MFSFSEFNPRLNSLQRYNFKRANPLQNGLINVCVRMQAKHVSMCI